MLLVVEKVYDSAAQSSRFCCWLIVENLFAMTVTCFEKPLSSPPFLLKPPPQKNKSHAAIVDTYIFHTALPIDIHELASTNLHLTLWKASAPPSEYRDFIASDSPFIFVRLDTCIVLICPGGRVSTKVFLVNLGSLHVSFRLVVDWTAFCFIHWVQCSLITRDYFWMIEKWSIVELVSCFYRNGDQPTFSLFH